MASETTIEQLTEPINTEFGFSITISQVDEAGSNPFGSNGAVGYEEEYIGDKEISWITGIPDDTHIVQGAPIDEQIFNEDLFSDSDMVPLEDLMKAEDDDRWGVWLPAADDDEDE